MIIFLQLFYTFFIIGLFGFGGGYGMLSLIQTETVMHHHWLSSAEFTNIVAISQMTPGPIGINSATYCGYAAVHNMGLSNTMAIFGSITATFALVLPSLILMLLISKMFPEIYEDALGSICLYGASSCGGWSAGCCNLVALQCRKLLAAKYKCVAIFY